MDEITILKNSEILDNDINYFYQKILNEYPIMDFGIAIKEKKTEDTEKKEYDKEKLNKKLFTKCINISTDIDNYNFYLNNKRVLIQIDNIKNHIDFTNIKYSTFSLNFRNLSDKKIGTILLIKFLEDYIKYYFQKKVLTKKKYTFKECLVQHTEYIFNTSLSLDNRTKSILTPFFDDNNERLEPNRIKKNDNLNYLIELDKIWVNRDKKTFGINWIVVQGFKNEDIFIKKCFLNPNGDTEVNKGRRNSYTRDNNLNIMNTTGNHNNTNNNNNNKSKIPPPPPIKESPLKLNINLNELQKVKNKITGSEIDD
jgi:hypothetical protein